MQLRSGYCPRQGRHITLLGSILRWWQPCWSPAKTGFGSQARRCYNYRGYGFGVDAGVYSCRLTKCAPAICTAPLLPRTGVHQPDNTVAWSQAANRRQNFQPGWSTCIRLERTHLARVSARARAYSDARCIRAPSAGARQASGRCTRDLLPPMGFPGRSGWGWCVEGERVAEPRFLG